MKTSKEQAFAECKADKYKRFRHSMSIASKAFGGYVRLRSR